MPTMDWRRRLYFAWLEKLGEGDVAADIAGHDAIGIDLCLQIAHDYPAMASQMDRHIAELWDDAQADPPCPSATD